MTPIQIMTSGEWSSLICPWCKNDYLHHGEVTVINRIWEDHDGLEIKVNQFVVESWPVKADKILMRRNCVKIEFKCEHCPNFSTLVLIQHKGNTFLYWDENPEILKG